MVSAGLPATSFAATSAPSTLLAGSTSATLVLRTGDTSWLSSAQHLSRADRLTRLSSVLPSASAQSSVAAAARAAGLVVDKATPWSVVVHGSASAIARVARSGRADGRLVSASPSLLPGVASVVLGGEKLAMRPAGLQQVHLGPDFHSAYTASSAAPPAGTSRPVIATLQFSGWDSSELSVEATHLSLPAPAPSVYTAVSVDGASTTQDDGYGGSGEVALDQESIYATDPYADQRAYFAGQTAQAEIDAYYAIAHDAMTSRGIMALSTSWDVCEHNTDGTLLDAGTLNAVHQAIAAVIAAGVTIFAASGDNGSWCYDGGLGVNYPASDPLVVSVGGTTLRTTPTTLTETAWGLVSHDSQTGPSGFDGSGGGISRLFPAPAYQALAAPGASGREVPDITADGDPDTGFQVYHDDGSGPADFLVGGTSLSSPISAALLVSELSARGYTTGGVGDIHQVLYSAPVTSFRDITVGTIGGVNAGPGYDMASGLGAPNWQALVNQMVVAPTLTVPASSASRTITPTAAVAGGQTVLGWLSGYGTPPACSASATKAAAAAPVTVPGDGHFTIWVQAYTSSAICLTASAATTVDTTGPVGTLTAKALNAAGSKVAYSWSLTDPGSGVVSVSASVTRNGVPVWSAAGAAAGGVTLPGKAGSIYRLVVVGKDGLGNTSTTTRDLSVAFDDRNFALSGKWTRVKSKVAIGGAVATASAKNAAAHVTAYGSTFALLTRTCPTCGVVGIYVDGKHLRDVSLYSKATRAGVSLKVTSFATAKSHKIVLVVRGTKPAHSKGSAVFVDGLLAT